ncbi:MAG: FecR domain-containing protein [Bryobacterales bacterium]|nr:FecR domain-containing protein [Bryobacterales bacterium]
MSASAPAEYAATVTLSTGRVAVVKAGESHTLMPGDTVKPGLEVFTGSDGYAVFQLQDGSSFEVYPNSRVLFRSNWGNWNDIFDIWVGRMKIHIEKIMGKPNPHRIHTPTAVISVRGTTFFVEVEEDSEATVVGVDTGEVMVEHRLLPTGKQQLLRTGEQLRIDRDVPIAKARIARDGVLRATMRTLSDVLYAVAVRNQNRGAGGVPVPGGGGGTTPLPGDEGPSAPPPPPGGTSAPTTSAPPAPPPPPGN